MSKIRTRLFIALGVMIVGAWATSPAFGATGSANTSDDPIHTHFCLHGPNSNMNPADQPAVNCNAYAAKSDVYINGGPTNGTSQLSDGYWFFAVLNPGGQQDPNDGATDNLSDAANGGGGDAVSNRVYHVTGGQIDSYSGTHAQDNTYQAIDGLLIGLAPFDDTSNPGGVYILASCFLGSSSTVHTVDPKDCKYDAFRVVTPNTPPGGVDVTCGKTATGSFSRTFTWSTSKSANPTHIATSNNTGDSSYSVVFTKSAGVDGGFTVSGTIQCFNTNDTAATSVNVNDAIGTTACTVTGGSSTIAANDSVIFSYTCPLTNVTASSSGTNVANVSWDKTSINSPTNSTSAMANWDFSAAPTLVGNCTNVSDTRSSTVTGTICATTTFSYTLTLNNAASGCVTYPNTASETTSGTSASASVQLCRLLGGTFTMGFWQNKNGQALIQAHAAAWCTALSAYPNVLTGLPNCSGANIAGNSTKAGSLAKYVYDTVKAANSAGDGLLMLKAQFLAMALNVANKPSVGTTSVDLSGLLSSSELTTLGLSSCTTVNSLLAATNSTLSIWSSNKMFVTDVQSALNTGNQGDAGGGFLTC